MDALWGECRRGFSASTWHHDDPPAGLFGISKVWRWARLELPFAWAEGVPVWVGVDGAGNLGRVVFGPPFPVEVVTVAEVDWHAAVTDEQCPTRGTARAPPCAS